ncbi:very short patch repair endonuclease [Granulicella arctica]|uniref:Very short patch repair endonuclease n=1 Tax=Granulicella arctica TaxID=940613 RepID=A0A7Y9PF11_9BACT|nr:DNA mismatch endonuclease (patch repair protein) [Granulicella arctica]
MVDHIDPARRSLNMAAVRSKHTEPELVVRKIVYGLGYRYRLHWEKLPGKPDLVFPGKRKVIFVHGCFWHGHDCIRGRLPSTNLDFWEQKVGKNKERDSRVRNQLEAQGWNVLTLWQCRLKEASELKQTIVRFLKTSHDEGDVPE